MCTDWGRLVGVVCMLGVWTAFLLACPSPCSAADTQPVGKVAAISGAAAIMHPGDEDPGETG